MQGEALRTQAQVLNTKRYSGLLPEMLKSENI